MTDPAPPPARPPSLWVAGALGAVFGVAAAAAWRVGDPYAVLVFVVVFLGGGFLIAWVDSPPR